MYQQVPAGGQAQLGLVALEEAPQGAAGRAAPHPARPRFESAAPAQARTRRDALPNGPARPAARQKKTKQNKKP